MIYFIQPLTDEPILLSGNVSVARPIKIGCAVAPESRVKAISKLFQGVELAILGVIPGGMATEKQLHVRFSEHRVIQRDTIGRPARLEWFFPSPPILDFIKDHAKTVEEIVSMPTLPVPISDELLSWLELLSSKQRMTIDQYLRHMIKEKMDLRTRDCWPYSSVRSRW